MRLAQRIVGNITDAEDVTQGLWLRVQRVDDDPPIENKRAYLFRLATNLAADHIKAERRKLEVHEEARAWLWGTDYTLAADRVVIAQDTLRRIAVILANLPDQTRRIFHLHRFGGMTQRAIAEELGISTTAVEKHMRRAMSNLAAARDDSN